MRPEPGNAAMVGIILIVGITTLTGAETATMRWLGIAVLIAGTAGGWAAWRRSHLYRQKAETHGETRLERAVNLLINMAAVGMLATMVAVLTMKNTVGLPTS